jgi:threonine aldolase
VGRGPGFILLPLPRLIKETLVKRGFASDNNAGIHPAILESIAKANSGHMLAYGDDEYTKSVIQRFKTLFQKPCEIFFVFNGTAANVLGLQALLKSHEAVICAATAHINVDECGAPEFHTGAKLLTVATPHGKLTPKLVEALCHGVGNQHHVQPRVISISQVTEMGTVYSAAEIKELADFAHARGMYLHMDGARIANAVAAQGITLSQMVGDTGVDVLSFGGTKNGLMLGEAVVFFQPQLAKEFLYLRKQSMQLASKMRFIACQFEALLENDLWLKNARHANAMAKLLAAKVAEIPAVQVTQTVEANGVFARVPRSIIEPLQKEFFFWIWDEADSVVRWMTSFDTTEKDINDFVAAIRRLAK